MLRKPAENSQYDLIQAKIRDADYTLVRSIYHTAFVTYQGALDDLDKIPVDKRNNKLHEHLRIYCEFYLIKCRCDAGTTWIDEQTVSGVRELILRSKAIEDDTNNEINKKYILTAKLAKEKLGHSEIEVTLSKINYAFARYKLISKPSPRKEMMLPIDLNDINVKLEEIHKAIKLVEEVNHEILASAKKDKSIHILYHQRSIDRHDLLASLYELYADYHMDMVENAKTLASDEEDEFYAHYHPNKDETSNGNKIKENLNAAAKYYNLSIQTLVKHKLTPNKDAGNYDKSLNSYIKVHFSHLNAMDQLADDAMKHGEFEHAQIFLTKLKAFVEERKLADLIGNLSSKNVSKSTFYSDLTDHMKKSQHNLDLCTKELKRKKTEERAQAEKEKRKTNQQNNGDATVTMHPKARRVHKRKRLSQCENEEHESEEVNIFDEEANNSNQRNQDVRQIADVNQPPSVAKKQKLDKPTTQARDEELLATLLSSMSGIQQPGVFPDNTAEALTFFTDAVPQQENPSSVRFAAKKTPPQTETVQIPPSLATSTTTLFSNREEQVKKLNVETEFMRQVGELIKGNNSATLAWILATLAENEAKYINGKSLQKTDHDHILKIANLYESAICLAYAHKPNGTSQKNITDLYKTYHTTIENKYSIYTGEKISYFTQELRKSRLNKIHERIRHLSSQDCIITTMRTYVSFISQSHSNADELQKKLDVFKKTFEEKIEKSESNRSAPVYKRA